MPEAGIVVVTYESEAEIGACLDRALPTGAEIVVVDNASTDRTRQEVTRRNVRLITNPENRGFAAAVNQGQPLALPTIGAHLFRMLPAFGISIAHILWSNM